jgi:opacity protein-like surface antigen
MRRLAAVIRSAVPAIITITTLATLIIIPSPARADTDRAVPSWEGRAVIRVNGGLSFPVGNFGDAFNTGFGFGGSIGYGVSRDVLISWAIAYHSFEFSRDEEIDWSVTPMTFNADYRIPTNGSFAPWVGGGLGLYRVNGEFRVGGPGGVIESEDFNNFGLNFGMGVGVPLSEKAVLGTGFKFHYVAGDEGIIDTPFVTYQIGVGFIL